jgi:glutaminyl-peptide cyclotransferase
MKISVIIKILFLLSISLSLSGCLKNKPAAVYGYKVINIYPHDANAYTEGLLFEDGSLYESTGREGQSSLRKVELSTGRVLQRIEPAKEYYCEGITMLKEKIYQLMWKSRKGFIYDKKDFRVAGQFTYKTEGWGLTTNGRFLIMSDGSSYLYFYEPETMREVKKIKVCDNNGAVSNLNELEFVKGFIYANIWMTDTIVIISPDNGTIVGRVDLRELMKDKRPADGDGVLNGIAYDEKNDRLFVTGKFWPELFEIRLENMKNIN